MTPTYDRLAAILARDYKDKFDPAALSPETRLDALGIDSLGTVELLWTVEDEFKVKLPAEPVDLATLGDVVRTIDAVVAAQSAATAAPTA